MKTIHTIRSAGAYTGLLSRGGLERRPVCLTERNRAVASRPRRDEGVGGPRATEEQRRDAPQIRGFATEGKPVGALGMLLVLAVLVGTHSPAQAQKAGAAACSFIEIKATNDAGGIDPKLSKLEGKLKKPPFSAWKTFSSLAQHTRRLNAMKVETIALELGGKLSVQLREHSKVAGKKDRVSLSLTLDDKRGKRALDSTVSVDAGDYVVIGYPLPDGNGHLLAMTCKVE